jgi:hypothetical protein
MNRATPSTLERRADRIRPGDVIVAGRSTERAVLAVSSVPRGYGRPIDAVTSEATVTIRTTHEHRGQDDIRLGASEKLVIVAPIVRTARALGSVVPNVGDLVTYHGLYGAVPARVAGVDVEASTLDLVSTARRSAYFPRGYAIGAIPLYRVTVRRHNGVTEGRI